MLHEYNIGIVQRTQQFDLKHGSDCLKVGSIWLYSNGAYRDVHPEGLLAEPPRDPYERSKLIVQYHEEKLRQASDKFNELKLELTYQGKAAVQHNTDDPSDAQIEELKRRLAEVRKCQADLATAKEQLDEHTPQWKKYVRPAESVQRSQDRLKAIQDIKI